MPLLDVLAVHPLLLQTADVVVWHLGTVLHEHERWLVPLLAIGPFIVLFVVLYLLRRRDVGD